MPITASIKIKGYVQGYGCGRMEIDTAPLTNATSVPGVVELVLAAGNNTIAVPVGAKGVVITLDPTSTIFKTLKGIAGDTGILISSTNEGGSFVLPLFQVTSFVISASAVDTGKLTKFQFF